MHTALIALLLTAAAPQTTERGLPTGSEAVRPEMIHGLWSNDGDCRQGMLIRAKGTFHSYMTGDDGAWRLQGNLLTLTTDGAVQALRLLAVQPDRVIMAGADGAVGHSFRCSDRPLIPIA